METSTVLRMFPLWPTGPGEVCFWTRRRVLKILHNWPARETILIKPDVVSNVLNRSIDFMDPRASWPTASSFALDANWLHQIALFRILCAVISTANPGNAELPSSLLPCSRFADHFLDVLAFYSDSNARTMRWFPNAAQIPAAVADRRRVGLEISHLFQHLLGEA